MGSFRPQLGLCRANRQTMKHTMSTHTREYSKQLENRKTPVCARSRTRGGAWLARLVLIVGSTLASLGGCRESWGADGPMAVAGTATAVPVPMAVAVVTAQATVEAEATFTAEVTATPEENGASTCSCNGGVTAQLVAEAEQAYCQGQECSTDEQARDLVTALQSALIAQPQPSSSAAPASSAAAPTTDKQARAPGAAASSCDSAGKTCILVSWAQNPSQPDDPDKLKIGGLALLGNLIAAHGGTQNVKFSFFEAPSSMANPNYNGQIAALFQSELNKLKPCSKVNAAIFEHSDGRRAATILLRTLCQKCDNLVVTDKCCASNFQANYIALYNEIKAAIKKNPALCLEVSVNQVIAFSPPVFQATDYTMSATSGGDISGTSGPCRIGTHCMNAPQEVRACTDTDGSKYCVRCASSILSKSSTATWQPVDSKLCAFEFPKSQFGCCSFADLPGFVWNTEGACLGIGGIWTPSSLTVHETQCLSQRSEYCCRFQQYGDGYSGSIARYRWGRGCETQQNDPNLLFFDGIVSHVTDAAQCAALEKESFVCCYSPSNSYGNGANATSRWRWFKAEECWAENRVPAADKTTCEGMDLVCCRTGPGGENDRAKTVTSKIMCLASHGSIDTDTSLTACALNGSDPAQSGIPADHLNRRAPVCCQRKFPDGSTEYSWTELQYCTAPDGDNLPDQGNPSTSIATDKLTLEDCIPHLGPDDLPVCCRNGLGGRHFSTQRECLQRNRVEGLTGLAQWWPEPASSGSLCQPKVGCCVAHWPSAAFYQAYEHACRGLDGFTFYEWDLDCEIEKSLRENDEGSAWCRCVIRGHEGLRFEESKGSYDDCLSKYRQNNSCTWVWATNAAPPGDDRIPPPKPSPEVNPAREHA